MSSWHIRESSPNPIPVSSRHKEGKSTTILHPQRRNAALQSIAMAQMSPAATMRPKQRLFWAGVARRVMRAARRTVSAMRAP